MGRAIVVGDRNQAIYFFRGADANSFDNIRKMLTKNGRSCVDLQLPVNYRCDKKIIEDAQRLVPELQGFNKADGVVDEIMFSGMLSRVNNNGTDIELPDGVNGALRSLPLPGKNCTFAILARVNVPLVITAYQLIAQKKRVQIIGRSQIGAPLIDLIQSLCGTNSNEEAFTNRISNQLDESGQMVEEGLLSRLTKYLMMQKAKLTEEGHKAALEAIEQNVECVQVIAVNVHDDKVSSIIEQINTLFVEEPDPNTIQLASIHRSKGLEFEVVFILRPDLMPHPRAKSKEELVQEVNMQYVASTRAKNRLYYVSDFPFGNNQMKPFSLENRNVPVSKQSDDVSIKSSANNNIDDGLPF